MAQAKHILAAAVLVIGSAHMGMGAASDDSAETPQATVPQPRAPQARGWRGEMDLQRWHRSTFKEDLTQAVVDLSAAHGVEGAQVLLDTAELYLAHMLLNEAASTLKGTKPQLPQQRRRQQALRDAADLLLGRPVKDFAKSPLMDEGRPDKSFWASLQAISAGDVALLRKHIRPSFQAMGYQSRAVLRAVLPVFIEAAVETGNHDHAKSALNLMRELPDLDLSPTGYFLRGRAAEVRGNNSTALEMYFEAAKGWDQYAARARLAVADMSLRNGSEGALMAAQSTLKEGAEAWRGNRYELELLKRQARVFDALENGVDGLLARGKLIARFPQSAEAELSKSEAAARLERMYAQGKEGQFPLGPWMDVHLQFLPLFRDLPSFAHRTEDLGDYVLGLGATDLAAQEYRRAIELTRAPIREEDRGAPNADLTRLHIKLAQAQLKAGLPQAAQITLGLIDPPEEASEKNRYLGLRAEALAALGDRPAVIKLAVPDPSAQHLRSLGDALLKEEAWASAVDVFRRMWEKHPQEFGVDDASHLLIAALRQQDQASIDKVLHGFPNLTDKGDLIVLAQSLTEVPPQVLPLRADDAQERLQSLQETFENLQKSGISP